MEILKYMFEPAHFWGFVFLLLIVMSGISRIGSVYKTDCKCEKCKNYEKKDKEE